MKPIQTIPTTAAARGFIPRTLIPIPILAFLLAAGDPSDARGGQLGSARREIQSRSRSSASSPGPSRSPGRHESRPPCPGPRYERRATPSPASIVVGLAADCLRSVPHAGPAACETSTPPVFCPPAIPESPGDFFGAVRGEYTSGGHGLNRFAISVTLSILETEWQHYIERLPGGATDSMTLGTIGLVLPLQPDERVTFLLGGGYCGYHDPYLSEGGLYFKAGMVVFPVRPLVLHAEVWCGGVGGDEHISSTLVGGARATAGLLWNRFEAFGGWQATWVGDVTLGGPTAGVRLWF